MHTHKRACTHTYHENIDVVYSGRGQHTALSKKLVHFDVERCLNLPNGVQFIRPLSTRLQLTYYWWRPMDMWPAIHQNHTHLPRQEHMGAVLCHTDKSTCPDSSHLALLSNQRSSFHSRVVEERPAMQLVERQWCSKLLPCPAPYLGVPEDSTDGLEWGDGERKVTELPEFLAQLFKGCKDLLGHLLPSTFTHHITEGEREKKKPSSIKVKCQCFICSNFIMQKATWSMTT